MLACLIYNIMIGLLNVVFLSFLALGSARKTEYKQSEECRARAWVRAPNLVPNQLIQGDVKIKVLGSCPDIHKYVLGLRFKERYFSKLTQEGVEFPISVPDNPVLPTLQRQSYVVEDSFEEYAQDSTYIEGDWDSLGWVVRVEERVGFETKHVLQQVQHDGDAISTDLEQQFNILVPNTNYPPALDNLGDYEYEEPTGNIINTEHTYEYFAEVHFSNGSMREIPIGITSFSPILPTLTGETETVYVALQQETRNLFRDDTSPDEAAKPRQSNYTAEITFPSGRTLEQGTTPNITVVIHRTGFADWSESSSTFYTTINSQQVLQWPIPSADAPGTRGAIRSYVSQLYAEPEDPIERCGEYHSEEDTTAPGLLVVKQLPISGIDIKSGAIVTTSSAPGMVQLFVPPEAVPNFITTFSAIKNRLNIELSVTRPKEEPLDLSHYVDQLLTEEEYDDEEYDWVPWSKSEMWHDYHQYHAEVDVWIVPSSRDSDSSAPVHYLSDDARSPIFVDALSAKDLQSKSAEERNLLAPLAKAQVVETEEGEDIVYKYHDPYRWKYPIYVGETWTRKVEKSIKHHGGDGDSVFVVQTAL